MKYPILRFFDYTHLPDNLQNVSAPFHHLAWSIANNSPPGPEVSAGLRKLLEAKDCIVRSHIPEKSG